MGLGALCVVVVITHLGLFVRLCKLYQNTESKAQLYSTEPTRAQNIQANIEPNMNHTITCYTSSALQKTKDLGERGHLEATPEDTRVEVLED